MITCRVGAWIRVKVWIMVRVRVRVRIRIRIRIRDSTGGRWGVACPRGMSGS